MVDAFFRIPIAQDRVITGKITDESEVRCLASIKLLGSREGTKTGRMEVL